MIFHGNKIGITEVLKRFTVIVDQPSNQISKPNHSVHFSNQGVRFETRTPYTRFLRNGSRKGEGRGGDGRMRVRREERGRGGGYITTLVKMIQMSEDYIIIERSAALLALLLNRF